MELWKRIVAYVFVLAWPLSFASSAVPFFGFSGLLAFVAASRLALRERTFPLSLLIIATIATFFGCAWAPIAYARYWEFPMPFCLMIGAALAVVECSNLWLYAIARHLLRSRCWADGLLFDVLLFACFENAPIRFLPWSVGYGAGDVSGLRQLAEFGGAPMVSLAVLLLMVPIAHAFVKLERCSIGRSRFPVYRLSLAIGCLLSLLGYIREESLASELESARRVRVAVVQPCVIPFGGVRPSARRDELRDLSIVQMTRLMTEASKDSPDLIIAPESSVLETLPDPSSAEFAPAIESMFDSPGSLGRADVSIMFGAREESQSRATPDAMRPSRTCYNSVYVRTWDRGSPVWRTHRKAHLMPFAEADARSDLSVGSGCRLRPWSADQGAIGVGSIRVAIVICYESLLPSYVRRVCRLSGADLLVNVSNDSYFDGTSGPSQHLNFARFRAIEHGIPMIFNTATGPTALIRPNGATTVVLGARERGWSMLEIELIGWRETIYDSIGFLLPEVEAIALACIVTLRVLRTRWRR